MKKIIHILLVLTMVGFLSGLCLALVYKSTAPIIAANQENQTQKAVFKVFPQAKNVEQLKNKAMEIFLVKDAMGNNLGYAFTCAGNGYQGEIKIMVGIKTDMITMTGIEILESQETPGLGQEITADFFKKQFINLMSVPDITYVKGAKPTKKNEIETITGATISSKAVVNILNKGIQQFKEEVK